MSRKVKLGFFALVFCVAVTACARIDEPGTGAWGGGQPDAIPLEYGEFVSATPDPTNPFGVILWFVKPDKTIVAVRANLSRGQISPGLLTLPRK